MADYLLDTNILRYWFDENTAQHGPVAARIEQLGKPDPSSGYVSRLFISVITLAEIEYGHRVLASQDLSALREYRAFLGEQVPPALELQRAIREPYAVLRSWLFERFSPKESRHKVKRPEQLVDPISALSLGIDENDLWIAAHASLNGLVLVTADRMSRIAEAVRANPDLGLSIEDWTLPLPPR